MYETDVWIVVEKVGGGNIDVRQWLNAYVCGACGTQYYPHIRQNVPTWAPLGAMKYWAYCGDYSLLDVIDSTYFDFTVVSGFGGTSDSWDCSGWGDASAIPTEFALNASYPNPFNATTVIPFDLAASGNVSLKVYNLAGQLVETLVDGDMSAGHHSINWDASSVASGIYFYKLQTENNVSTMRMNLLK